VVQGTWYGVRDAHCSARVSGFSLTCGSLMFVGSVDQERKAYIHLLLYPHGSDITSQDPNMYNVLQYIQVHNVHTLFTNQRRPRPQGVAYPRAVRGLCR